MQRKPPFFYLLPGVGFGVEHSGERHAVPIPSSISDLKRIAATASQLIAGAAERVDNITPAQIPANELYDLWLELDKDTTPLFPTSAPLVTRLSLQLESLKEGHNGLRDSEPRPELNQLRAILEKRGCVVKYSSTFTLPPHIFRLGLLDIPVARSEKQGILGEGKGFAPSVSEYAAMAEAIERIVASEQDLSRILPGRSPKEMTRQGFLLPNIEPGARDLYSDDLCIDWTPAYLYPASPAWMPAELVWHLYSPLSGFRGFDMRQTIGLASGSTITEAFANALLETIERDAYAIVMRCRVTCPSIAQEEIDACGPELTELLKDLDRKGIDVHIKWISLDWPIPVAHVLFSDRMDRIPAHAHGCSAGLTHSVAITRAVLEAVQMHEGLARVASENWERMAARIESSHSHPYYAWGDPLFRPHLTHLMNSNPCTSIPSAHKEYINHIAGLCEWMMSREHRIFWAHLGTLGGLEVVRAFVEGLMMPDARLEYLGKRLSSWVDKQKIPGPYTDPILT